MLSSMFGKKKVLEFDIEVLKNELGASDKWELSLGLPFLLSLSLSLCFTQFCVCVFDLHSHIEGRRLCVFLITNVLKVEDCGFWSSLKYWRLMILCVCVWLQGRGGNRDGSGCSIRQVNTVLAETATICWFEAHKSTASLQQIRQHGKIRQTGKIWLTVLEDMIDSMGKFDWQYGKMCYGCES